MTRIYGRIMKPVNFSVDMVNLFHVDSTSNNCAIYEIFPSPKICVKQIKNLRITSKVIKRSGNSKNRLQNKTLKSYVE